MSLSLKTEDPKIDIIALFSKDADTKPVEGEVPPSVFHEFESDMNGALSRIAPIDPNLPRGIGMREMFTDPAAWVQLVGETYADYVNLDPATGLPTMRAWTTVPARPVPGPEPRVRPARTGEDRATVLSEVNQRHYTYKYIDT